MSEVAATKIAAVVAPIREKPSIDLIT